MSTKLRWGAVKHPWGVALAVLHAKRTRHTQMHQQHIARSKVRQKIFGASAEAFDGLTGQSRGKIPLKRKAQVFAPDFHFRNPPPLHRRLQAAADGLDLG